MQVAIPELYCPFPSRINPHVESAHCHSLEWAQRHHLVDDVTYHRLQKARLSWLAARVCLGASAKILNIVSDFVVWIFIFDDHCEQVLRRGELVSWSNTFSHIIEIAEGDGHSREESYFVKAFRDIMQRTHEFVDAKWFRRFAQDLDDYFEGLILEEQSHSNQSVLNLDTYWEIRAKTVAAYCLFDWHEVSESAPLPEPIWTNPCVQNLRTAANIHIACVNDICSLHKEIQGGEKCNLVLVIQRQYELSLKDSLEYAARMVEQEVETFLKLKTCLPSFGEPVDAALERYIQGLCNSMRANLDWSLESSRYNSADCQLLTVS